MDPVAPHDRRGLSGALAPEPVLVSVAALGAVAAQLAFRGLDDSRLTSWRWVAAGIDPLRLFALVAAAIAAAHLAARVATRLPRPVRRPGPLLFALALAVAASTFGVPEAIVDASRYFAQAKQVELHGLGGFPAAWGREVPAWTDLPLVPALDGLLFRALGEVRVHVQLLRAVLFAGTVVLTWRTGAALFDPEVGVEGAALLLAIPYLLTQVPLMLVDVPTMFFLSLATWATVEAVRRGGAARIGLAALAAALAALSKYSAWPLLTGIGAVALAERRRSPGALRALAGIAVAAGALLAAALVPLREVVSGQLALLLSYQAPGLRRWGESFGSIFLFQVHPFVTAAAVASAVVAVRRRDARWIAVAWPVLLLLALHVRRIRYWVPAFPMLALMAALGLQALRDARVRALAVACAVASSLVVALYGQVPFLERTSASNLERAGAYLDAIEEPAAEVFTPARPDAEVNPAVAVPILDLHTRKRLVYAYAPPPPRTSRAARESPLRFTWEYRNPPYYADGAEPAAARAAVVVTGDAAEPLPPDLARRLEGLRLARTFAADEGVFEYRTIVRVYRRAADLAGPGDPR